MNKKGMGTIGMIMVLLFGMIGFLVSQQVDFDVEKFKGALNWTEIALETPAQPELGKALGYIVNGFGNAMFEFAKWVATFAKDNPDISYNLLMYLVIASLLAPIIVALIKIIVIIFILVNEWIQSKREKRKYS